VVIVELKRCQHPDEAVVADHEMGPERRPVRSTSGTLLFLRE